MYELIKEIPLLNYSKFPSTSWYLINTKNSQNSLNNFPIYLQPRATLQKYRKNTNTQYTKRLKNAPQRRLPHTHTRILKSQASTLSVMTAGCLCRASASQLLQSLLLFVVLVAALCSILQGGNTSGATLQCSQETNHRAKGKKCSDKVAVATCKLRGRERQKRQREFCECVCRLSVCMCVCLLCCVCAIKAEVQIAQASAAAAAAAAESVEMSICFCSRLNCKAAQGGHRQSSIKGARGVTSTGR